MQRLLKTKVVSGPFAEKIYTYQKLNLNFKTACERLENGREVVCLRTGERLSMDSDGFKANFDRLNTDQFIAKYSDELFNEQ